MISGTCNNRERWKCSLSCSPERYKQGSVLIRMTAAAPIDRLFHYCVILEINIPSYRVEQAKKAKEEP